MSTKSILQAIKDEASRLGVSQSKVIDTTLHSGILTFGNLNDQVNMFNRVAPNITPQQGDQIMSELAAAGVTEGQRLVYELTDQKSENHILEYPIGSMFIAFTLIN